jgi:ERCC4-type nuclease
MVELIIDNREHKLIELLKGRIEYSIEQLDIGDILFRDNSKTILVIERKTIDDLKASICDTRAREQKARLIENNDRNRIMYLIEGNLNKSLTDKVSGMPVSTLIGSIINTQLRDNIKVYKTYTIKESVEFIIRLHDKLTKDGDDFFKTEDSNTSAGEYAATLKTKKKSNMTPEVWLNCQLSLVPQVTEKISVEIVKTYPHVRALIHAYDELDNETSKHKMLSNITYPIKNDKTRRVGDKISTRIYQYFNGLVVTI